MNICAIMAFLCNPTGRWRLAPAYDLNPIPLDIQAAHSRDRNRRSGRNRFSRFGVRCCGAFWAQANNARKIASEVGNAVKNWRQTAKTLGLSADQISRASAFEHKELEQATSGTD
jgi:serine/threonine-protein kinase HipA